jgi:hypothetical protein
MTNRTCVAVPVVNVPRISHYPWAAWLLVASRIAGWAAHTLVTAPEDEFCTAAHLVGLDIDVLSTELCSRDCSSWCVRELYDLQGAADTSLYRNGHSDQSQLSQCRLR